jgi:hypothetical protein
LDDQSLNLPIRRFTYRVGMAKPTEEDRIEATRRLLAGLVAGVDANRLVVDMADLHVRHNTFPGEVFMELAADALRAAGVERAPGIVYCELLSKHLGEVEFRGKEHRRIQYAILTAFAVHGGLEPDLLDEVTYWIEQYWQYALLAAIAIIRQCAEQSATPLHEFVSDLAAAGAIDIS